MKKIERPIIGGISAEPNLDMVVGWLQSLKSDRINWYFDFFGHRLYSDTTTLESAYKEVYGCTREEYMKKILENYKKYKQARKELSEKTRRKNKKYLEKYRHMASNVFPKDKMDMFDDVMKLLNSYYMDFGMIEEKFKIYLEILIELNKEDYSLAKAEELFNNIKDRLITINFDILRTIKELSIHGEVLFDKLYDQEKDEELKSTKLEIPSLASSSMGNYVPLTEDEEAIRHDRTMTALYLASERFEKSITLKKN